MSACPWWPGIGFHPPFRCSDEPKALRVKPNPPEKRLFQNASRARGCVPSHSCYCKNRCFFHPSFSRYKYSMPNTKTLFSGA
ncbi:hypothetical protein CHM34_07880 [Paludifilum halophilum]|uniref:Uncharacterized protein n=1 Tax=Paludifilum halophilum TaxID=1642702 RepID=A0A235B8V8_9BACL|nr:hypothetical protein CHM34_07880 [Paludifilum halophilum]